MKLGIKGILCAAALSVMATACSDKETWTVTCPWAPSGVAAVASQKASTLSTKHSQDFILVSEAIKGDVATINTWVLDKKANDPNLVFVSEGVLSITPIIDPNKMKFTADDLTYVENLYSSIFVLSCQSKLNIKSIPELQEYVKNTTDTINVAVNGATSSEAFLAAALFSSMGAADKLKLTPYNSAAEAAQAVSRGETLFAVSHQSQILEASEQKMVNVIAAFNDKPLSHGPFAGVEGVGAYNYPYFKNCCFIMARAGTDAEKVEKLRALYDDILKDKEVSDWMLNTMLIEVDPMTPEQVEEHLQTVRNIINEYKDVIL